MPSSPLRRPHFTSARILTSGQSSNRPDSTLRRSSLETEAAKSAPPPMPFGRPGTGEFPFDAIWSTGPKARLASPRVPSASPSRRRPCSNPHRTPPTSSRRVPTSSTAPPLPGWPCRRASVAGAMILRHAGRRSFSTTRWWWWARGRRSGGHSACGELASHSPAVSLHRFIVLRPWRATPCRGSHVSR